MKPIYKVIDKDLLKKLEAEIERKHEFMQGNLLKAQLVLPEVETLAFTNDSFTGGIHIMGLIFEDGHEISTRLFKKVSDRVTGTKYVYIPKKNTKEGKELSKKLDFIGKTEKFFGKEFEGPLNFAPEQRQVFSDGYLTLNVLRFGYKKTEKCGYRFVFSGYDGYEPPKGKAEEMKVSDYNKLFGRS